MDQVDMLNAPQQSLRSNSSKPGRSKTTSSGEHFANRRRPPGRRLKVPPPHPALPLETPVSKGSRVLEMRVYWGHALLQMHHFASPKAVRIGEKKGNDFFLSSELLPTDSFPLVRCVDDEYVLSFTEGMKGEVELDGKIHTLDGLASRAHSDPELPGTYNIALPPNVHVVVHWEGVSFALRFVAPVRKTKGGWGYLLDLPFTNVAIASLAVHLVAVATLMVVPFDAEVIAEREYNRIIADISWPEMPPVPTPPSNNDAAQSPDAQPTNDAAQTRRSRTPKVAAHQGQATGEEIRGKLQNMVQHMQAATVGAGLSGVADGIRAVMAPPTVAGIGRLGEAIVGNGAFDYRAPGTLGGPRRVGPSKLGDPRAFEVKLTPRTKEPTIRLGTPEPMQNIDRDQVLRVVSKNRNQIRYCYESSLAKNTDLGGRILVQWIIGPDGRVLQAKVLENDMGSQAVGQCIAARIRTWPFPAPRGGGEAVIRYPFVFRSS